MAVRKEKKTTDFKSMIMGECPCGCGQPMMHHGHKLGRLLFIVGVLWALNIMNYLLGVSIWIQILIGLGFVMMKK